VAQEKKPEKRETSAIQEIDLKITLFESAEIVKKYIKRNNLQFKGMYLQGITLQYMKDHPKKGLCWHYAWNHKKPRLGGEKVLFHYMDGTIIIHRL